jgi:hypothetical protein
MDNDTWTTLERQFKESPIMRATPATDREIGGAQRQLGCSFHEDYVDFLLRYGGAMVGSYPIFGIHRAHVMGKNFYSVVDVTRRFRDDRWPGTSDWYVISMDGSGNPIGVDVHGRVWISDHDQGNISLLAPNFETFLIQNALQSGM